MAVGAINSLSNIASSSATTSSAASQTESLSLNFATYLKILTVQLKNQDPTNATDPNQFTQQLIMMQQVQAQINNNQAMEELRMATVSNGLATGVGYIGNYVRATTSYGDFSLQEGTSTIGYTLDTAASNTIISIADSSGKAVAKLSGSTYAGDNYITWDGTKSDGTKAEDGAYTFTIMASDNSGDSVTASNPTALFKITAVESNTDGTLTLQAGNLSLLSSDITGVYTPATIPSSKTGTLI